MPVIDMPPAFVNGVNQPDSATYLNAIRKAAIQLDAWSYRILGAFDSSAGEDTKTAGQYTNIVGGIPFRTWRGYFQWMTGMTTLTIVGRTSGAPAGATLKTYVNDSGTAADTISSPLPATFTRTISISSGYTDGQIVAVEIKVETAYTATMEIVIHDVYASPVAYSPTWGGTPTFSGTYDAGRLNQLVDACNWLYGRIDATPMIPRRAQLYALGPFGDPSGSPLHGHWPLYYGAVQRSYTNSILRVAGFFVNVTSTAMHFTIYVNGALAYTSPDVGPGTWPFFIPIVLTNAVGTRTEVSIFGEVVTAGPNNPPVTQWYFSRFTIQYVREEPSSSGYPYASSPAAFTQGSISPSSLNSALNSISTIVANTKSRIDANPAVWGRARAVRRWYKLDEVAGGIYDKRAPIIFQRVGDRLIVAGRGVTIGFGALQPPSDPTKIIDDYTFSQTSSVIDADKVQTQTVWLDSIPGLEYGMLYYVQGEGALWACERLSP